MTLDMFRYLFERLFFTNSYFKGLRSLLVIPDRSPRKRNKFLVVSHSIAFQLDRSLSPNV